MHKRIGENTRVNQKHTSNGDMKADLKHIVTDAAVILISDKLFNTLWQTHTPMQSSCESASSLLLLDADRPYISNEVFTKAMCKVSPLTGSILYTIKRWIFLQV